MSELSKLPNIGKVQVERLTQAGIKTAEDLDNIGSKEAFLRLRINDPDACYNNLCALEGAVQRIRWHNLSKDTKEDLKKFYNNLKD